MLKERELDHKWLIDEEVRPGNVILDLGVNIGYYAAMEFKAMNGKGKIYSIEPDHRNIEFLVKNIALNGMEDVITFEQGAISNYNGQAEFALSKRTNLNSFGLVDSGSDVELVNVNVIDFGKYLSDKQRIDLVRMDIEGHENHVFLSLLEFIKEYPDLAPRKFIYEVHFYDDVQQMRDILEALFEFGYWPKYITSDDELQQGGSRFAGLGYRPIKTIPEWGVSRGVYDNVKNEDAIELISTTVGVRTVCLELKQ